MTRIRLPYIHEFEDRHGKVRRYVRLPGLKQIPLPGAPGTDEFMGAYRAALADARPREPIGANRNAPGSVASAVSLYLASAVFARLAPDTRRTRRNELERFRNKHGANVLDKMERKNVEQHIRDKSPVSARNCLKALSPWLAWCVNEGLTKSDPTAGIKRPTGKKEGYATWPQQFVDAFRKRHNLGTKARLAFELLVTTGAARVDAIRLGRQHNRDGVISFRRHKTDVLVEIPILPEFIAAIDAMPVSDHLTYLVTEYGKPFTPAGFGGWFRDRCNEAGIPVGFSAHGVRKYAATEHANRGATAHELMAWFGWLTIREAERYTRTAERRRLALGMVEKLR